MRQTIILLLLAALFPGILPGQSDSSVVIFTNSQEVNPYRYYDIKGTPYLFDTYVFGDIISSNIDVYRNLALNLNGHTKNFEVRRGNRIVELDQRWYLRVEIDPKLNPGLERFFGDGKIVFQRGLHPKLEHVFAHVIYPGTRVIFLKTFHADLSNKKVQDVGKTLDFQRFIGKYTYYLLQDGELKTVALRKPTFLKMLGGGKELESFIEENEIDFGNEREVAKIIAFYEKTL